MSFKEMDDVQLEFYFELGLTHTQWSFVENSLAELFSFLLQAPTGRAKTAFYAIQNFRSKLEAVDAVAQSNLPEDHLAAWNRVLTRLERASRKRNHLAHFKAVHRFKGDGLFSMELRPGGPAPAAGDNVYRTKDFVSVRGQYQALMFTLDNFLARLQERQEPWSKHLERPGDVPDSQKQEPPTAKELDTQPPPSEG